MILNVLIVFSCRLFCVRPMCIAGRVCLCESDRVLRGPSAPGCRGKLNVRCGLHWTSRGKHVRGPYPDDSSATAGQ